MLCRNFCYERGKFPQYRMTWCGGCYANHNNGGFTKSVKLPGGIRKRRLNKYIRRVGAGVTF